MEITRYVLADYDTAEEDFEYESFEEADREARKHKQQLLERTYIYDDTTLLQDYSGHEVPDEIMLRLPAGVISDAVVDRLLRLLDAARPILVEQSSTGDTFSLMDCTVSTEWAPTAEVVLYDQRRDEMEVPPELAALFQQALDAVRQEKWQWWTRPS